MCVAPPGREQRGVQVHTDREASGEDAPEPQAGPAEAHHYGYDAAVGPGAVDASPAPGAPAADGAAPLPDSADGAEADLSPTEARSVTGVQGVTAPRAMLRPVPEGFPTPPPRPARPNRRPAREQDSGSGSGPRRGVLIAAIVVVAVLALAVAVGGGVLALRALSSDSGPAADPAPAQGSDPADAAGGTVEIEGVTITEVSTEQGVPSVGTSDTAVTPEGEFVIVTIEVANESGGPVSIGDGIELETADGETVAPSRDAARVHIADSEPFGQATEGSATRFHLIYDVPIGAEPTALQVDLGYIGSGTLPLGS
jgi:hypothetical protein